MKWVLKKLSYNVDNNSRARHVLGNGLDIMLVLFYFAFSFYNAFTGVHNLEFFDPHTERFRPNDVTIRTVVTVCINFIVAFRLYIRLFIKWKDDMDYATNLLMKNTQYDKVLIEALEIRLRFVEYILGVMIALSLVLWCLGNVATPLIAGIVITATTLSCVNNLIDIFINMYQAKLKPGVLNYFEWR